MTMYKVTIDPCTPGSRSVHVFESREESLQFVDWMQNFNSDTHIKYEELENEEATVTESSTFI